MRTAARAAVLLAAFLKVLLPASPAGAAVAAPVAASASAARPQSGATQSDPAAAPPESTTTPTTLKILNPATAGSPPSYSVTDTLEVRAPRLTLREIIERSVEGEKTKLGGHHDMTYTETVRVVVLWKKKKEIRDIVYRGYDDVRGWRRLVQLDEKVHRYERKGDAWRPVQSDDEGSSVVRVEAKERSEFSDIPFFLEEQQEYTFTLLSRSLEVDHVIFKIGFEPRSPFKGLPSGTVYIDTDDFRIIHEEFRFDRNPFPLLVKDVRRISRHWTRLPGGEWVFTKVLLDVDLRGGWFGAVPEKVAVAVTREDFRFDQGYDHRLFGER